MFVDFAGPVLLHFCEGVGYVLGGILFVSCLIPRSHCHGLQSLVAADVDPTLSVVVLTSL